MGLDNGVILKADKSFPPYWVRFFGEYDFELGGFDLCYWCNCRGLRREIIYSITSSIDEAETTRYPLTWSNVYGLRQLLKRFTNRRVWEKYADANVEYKYMKWVLRRQRLALYLLERHMKKTPNAEAYFYDSY